MLEINLHVGYMWPVNLSLLLLCTECQAVLSTVIFIMDTNMKQCHQHFWFGLVKLFLVGNAQL